MKHKLQHLVFWMLVLGIWFLLRYEDYANPSMAFKITVIKVVDLALLVYITNYILIPRLLYKRNFFLFGFLFIIMIVASSLLKMNIIGRITNNPLLLNLSGNLKDRIYDNIIPHFFLVIAGAAIKFMIDQINLQKKMAEMAKEKAEAELSFLKSQINPHFLFNSLNSVYFSIDRNNENAREILHKFSEMLRYQLYEANGKKIPVEKEISYLKDYVDLQKLRKDENYSVEYYCAPNVTGFSIEPLLLIPFVENAFKHISNRSGKTNYIKMNMEKEDGLFKFNIENSKEKESVNNMQQGGIGLNNVKRRLELLYPGKYKLDIKETDDIYKVNFQLKI
ncbi:MAG TPA: histidine kinase [Chitinophagaceae bacterium]|nr:histidine kinase [Chitinophagaceae bacterium]